MLPLLSAQYCARQNATAFLELWALLLLLCGAGLVALFVARQVATDRRFAARLYACALFFFALLTGILAAMTFYGCSATAAGEQGLGTDLPAAMYTLLRCLGTDLLSTINGWVLFVLSVLGAIGLIVLGISRHRRVVRVASFAGAALMVILSFALAFFLLFGFSWCESERLM